MNKKELNVLGYFEERLNILMELASESIQVQNFNILKNICVDEEGTFVPREEFQYKVYDCENPYPRFNKDDIFAFSVVGNKSKEKVYKFFKQRLELANEQFVDLIHPTAYLAPSCRLNYGIQIEALASVSSMADIGFGVTVKRHASIGHHAKIGDFATINPSATIGGFAVIENNVLIGMGTNVIHNVKIGKNTIVGAGSNVVRDIPPNSVAYGNPCKVHRKID